MRDEHRNGSVWREALRATSLGWDLALPIFGGVLIGHLLDELLATSYVLTLSGLGLGIAAGFYNVIRSIQRVDKKSRRRSSPEERREERER